MTLVDAEEQLRNNTVGTAGELAHVRMFLLFALRRYGAFGELRTRLDEYVRDGLRRGDRYAATSYRWIGNLVWLAHDDVERAHADLAAWAARQGVATVAPARLVPADPAFVAVPEA